MTLREIAMSVAAAAVLVALIALVDDRVRERIGGVSAHAVTHRVSQETVRAEGFTMSVRDIATENEALTLVVVAGAVLFICMLRT